jgi:biotin transport system substrate-specific component
MKQKFSTKSMVLVSLFAAVLCVSAYISVTLPNGSHITFLNFIVMIVVLVFSVQDSAAIVAVWLLLGAVGVPVFVGGNAGIGYLLSPYGGYSFSFLAVAVLLPLIRGKKYRRIYYTVISLLGALLVDVIGAMWWMIIGHLTFRQAVVMGVLAFLPLDCVKAVVAAQVVPAFRRIVKGDGVNANVLEA